MKKEKEEVEEPSAPFWMTTFSDMVTLLLVFFILILSYSTIQLEKFKGAMSSMKGALGVMPNMESVKKKNDVKFREKLTTEARQSDEDFAYLREMISKLKVQKDVSVDLQETGIHIRLGDKIVFDLGKARIKPQAYPILNSIAKIARDHEIYVEGHTDDLPIRSARFPSNWELSTARALNVVKYLNKVEGIPAENLAAVGHGEHRPLVPNDSPENRAKNRRVEIYIRW